MSYTMKFARSETTERLAALDGRTLSSHEGFNRSNDGGWVIPIRDEAGEVVASVEVFFRGKAKRGAAHNAPDPEGQKIAQDIANQFNA